MGYSVKWVTEHLGITRDMLRHYEKEKLLPPNPSSQYRNYSDEDLELIWGIKLLIEIGFSTKEIYALMNDPAFDFDTAITQKVAELEKRQQKDTQCLQFAKSIKLLGHIPTSTNIGTIRFDEFLKYAHENWNFYGDPKTAPFMRLSENISNQKGGELSTDDAQQLLNILKDVERMTHTYTLHGYYQVISDMKELGADSDRVQRVVGFLYRYIIDHNTEPELDGKITPQFFAKYTAPFFLGGDIGRQYACLYGDDGCLFIAQAIAYYGGYQIDEL